MSNRYWCLRPSSAVVHTATDICQTDTAVCVLHQQLYIQQQTYVKQLLLSASFISSCTYSNRHMSNRNFCLRPSSAVVHTATDICQTDTAVCVHHQQLYIQQQTYVKQILLSASIINSCTYSNRHMSNRYCCLRPSSAVQDCTYSNRHMSNRYCSLLASKQRAISLWIGLFPSLCLHLASLWNWTVFTQHTNNSCKSKTAYLSDMFRPCSAIIRLTKRWC